MNMSLKNTLKMALKSILANKMRTILTMLGIIIGVFSVIVMVSLGQGATADVTESIEDMGSNLLSLSIFDSSVDFDNKNIEELAFVEGVEKISPSISKNATVKYGTESEDSLSVLGVNEEYAEIQNYAVLYGRFINPIDVDFRNKVAVIGYDTADTLFGDISPIDSEISVNGEKYTVVGVLEEKESSMMGNNNEIVIIPFTTGMRQFKSESIGSVVIQGNAEYGSENTQENIEEYLLEIYEDEDSYKIFNQEELLSTLNEITATLTLMLGGIAGISLIVGGIGIMNIMLVTVSERTREIGIRKAIGARRSNILTQFLIESSVISCLGGLVGIGLGIGATNIISNMMDIKSVINLEVITIAFGFSLFVGIFFGMYPANKASKLKPVDALRYE
jgi:putative ABC transport system permease protein